LGEKMMTRKPFIAGNWKMNMTAESGTALIEELIPLVKNADCDVALCVPAILIPAMTNAAKGTNIKIGAENVHWAESGAYTGEIDCAMLKEYGVEYAIIGHSERRQYFGETDEGVNKRTLAALNNGITPIVCVGETLQERECGATEAVLSKQLEEGLNGIDDITKVVIAYEPVWAIGTGHILARVCARSCNSVRRFNERQKLQRAYGSTRYRRRSYRRRIVKARLCNDSKLRKTLKPFLGQLQKKQLPHYILQPPAVGLPNDYPTPASF
jgi:triosephosphate isomerase